MKVTIEARINTEGTWWDVQIEHDISANMTPEQKVARIKAIIKGMASTGEIISRVSNNQPPSTPEASQPAPGQNNGANQASFTWPEPHCEVHREAMRQSGTQKTPGQTQFFCPKRMGEGYCVRRASVDQKNGAPRFWEVMTP